MYTNVFHIISTGKLATRWFDKLFNEINKTNCGYNTISWIPDVKGIDGSQAWVRARSNPPLVIAKPNTFYFNVNYGYNSFITKIQKSDDNYLGFYIYRDPREYVISAYYSWLYSHKGGHPTRKHLQTLGKDAGLKYVINQTNNRNEWNMIRSWGDSNNSKIFKLKLEDILGDDEKQNNTIDFIITKMGLDLMDEEITNIKNTMDYKNFSNGRKRGEINNHHHYRGGSGLTWKDEMSEDVINHFYKVTGDLVKVLGYE